MLIFVFIALIIYTIVLRQFILKKNIPFIYYREIPSNDTPAYVGKVIKQHVDGNDIVSTILDLSNRGYINITTEKINGKTKTLLHLQKNPNDINLEEHEIFLLNQIFKNGYDVVFDDYINSKKFKSDFKAFDKMLERKVERKSYTKSSLLKNINKIIFLTLFLLLGVTIFYSILLPITSAVSSSISLSNDTKILINIIISGIIFLVIAYSYISYINKSTSAQENINLKVTYIILLIIVGIILIIGKFDDITSSFFSEMIWYKIAINFIISVIVLLYMFNIIKHNENDKYLYYIFIVIGILCIIFNLKIALSMVVIFFATYIFFKSPRHINLKDNDYIYKWESFKKYLEDYSLMASQDEEAVLIWQRYLIYAISLGVNKKIIKHYGKLNHVILLDDQYLKRFYIEYLD